MSMSNSILAPEAPPRRSKGERTFDRIREVALDQFSRLGFERVTMGEIARAAEVSQPTLHYHFADKDQLWRSAMGLLGEAIAEEERLIAAARDASALTKLRIAMRHFLHLAWRCPALGRIVALEGMAGGERLDWLIAHLIGRRNRALVALIADAIAAGEIKPHPPEQILILLQTGAVGASNMAPMMRANFGFDPDTEAARRAYEDLVIDTMTAGLAVQS
jgi:AcrR family transcriptional regulator